VLGPWPEIALSAISVISVLAALTVGYRRRARRDVATSET
jgi:hypothetical protein